MATKNSEERQKKTQEKSSARHKASESAFPNDDEDTNQTILPTGDGNFPAKMNTIGTQSENHWADVQSPARRQTGYSVPGESSKRGSSRRWVRMFFLILGGIGLFGLFSNSSSTPAKSVAKSVSRASVKIEDIRVGDRVMGNLSAGEMAGETKVDPANWRKLKLQAEETWPDGTIDVIFVETLQPPEWIAKHNAVPGEQVPLPLDLLEMGLREGMTAKVITNEPCPKIKNGPGRVVLTTVNHLNNDTR